MCSGDRSFAHAQVMRQDGESVRIACACAIIVVPCVTAGDGAVVGVLCRLEYTVVGGVRCTLVLWDAGWRLNSGT